MSDDEFYIGYESGMPPRTRRATVTAAAAVAAMVLVVAATFVSVQHGLADSRFEYGQVRTFEGYLSLTPSPVLHVEVDGETHPHWLVAPGKFGPAAVLGDTRPGWVALSGTLIERGSWHMIEMVPGSVRAAASASPPPAATAAVATPRVLQGEIVDSKCFLGVMNPGERTVHRDCATRCLAGGVPPMLAYRDDTGSHLALLLGASSDVMRQGVGNTVTLSGLLSGNEEALVFTLTK
jgi:hypothetical protein